MSNKYPDDAIYNKLVRDKIPAIIESDGLKVETKILSPEEAINLLKKKAVEEGQELAEAKDLGDLKKEMADVLEILISLAEKLGIKMDEIEALRKNRAEKRGRFEKGIFLKRTYREKE